jgi:ribosomal protein L24
MKQLEVGDRVKVLTGDKDDEGTVLDVDERTEMVVVYLGRHVGRWTFHRDDLRKVRVH